MYIVYLEHQFEIEPVLNEMIYNFAKQDILLNFRSTKATTVKIVPFAGNDEPFQNRTPHTIFFDGVLHNCLNWKLDITRITQPVNTLYRYGMPLGNPSL